MPEFLAEVYVAKAGEAARLPDIETVVAAANQVTQEGSRVELLRLIHVPEDETCFYLFSAESADGVVDTADRAGLRLDRLAGVDEHPRPTSRRNR